MQQQPGFSASTFINILFKYTVLLDKQGYRDVRKEDLIVDWFQDLFI